MQYNIKKKEEVVEQAPQEEPNPLMRKKKTPEELAAEAEQEDLDDFTSKYFGWVRRMACWKWTRQSEEKKIPSNNAQSKWMHTIIRIPIDIDLMDFDEITSHEWKSMTIP